MQILLTTLNAKYIHTNLAIRLLYGLNKHVPGLAWHEFTIKMPTHEIVAYCESYHIVCFSCYIWNITQTLHVAEQLKVKNPKIKILLGGPEVSYEWQSVIELPYIDYIITGEGETPFAQFLHSYPNVEHIPNIVTKQIEQIHYIPEGKIFALEHYKHLLPYGEDEVATLKDKILYVETSRGCPYKCGFCLASLDNKVRYLDNAAIKQNLLYVMKHGKVIKFLDRTFNVKKDFALDIFEFILKNHYPQNVFQFEITADIVHPDIISFINTHVPKGLFRFEIGIQTVNQKANLEVSRKQSFEKTKGIILQLQNRVEMHLDLIVGLPHDYWDDIKYSFEEVFKLFAPELQLGFLKFLKGTPVRDQAANHQYVYDNKAPYQIIESKYLSKDELAQITIVENVLEIYWNKKRAPHTLKYITSHFSIFNFMQELGNYFLIHTTFHQYQLVQVYDILYNYINATMPNNDVLKQLVAIDFLLHHKVKPKSKYWNELQGTQRQHIISAYQLNHHKYRFAIVPLTFNYANYATTQTVVQDPDIFILQYDGITWPRIIHSPNVLHTTES